MAEEFWRGTGRRKTAVAQVRLMKGTGRATINGREIDSYFVGFKQKKQGMEPLEATNCASSPVSFNCL